MILLISFLSTCVALSAVWMFFIISYLSSGKADFIITLMGLFLPLVVVLMALAFVYVCLELKKTQFILKDWINILKRDILNETDAVHNQIGKELQAAMEKEAPAVMNISTDEPIIKYQNMSLPDDVELHFKG